MNHIQGRMLLNKTFTGIILLACLSSAMPLQAALIKENSLSAMLDDSAPTSTPIIDAANRVGADQFKDLAASFGASGVDKLIERATQVIQSHPNSGLAHEILGTAYFYKTAFKKAETHFRKATQLEPAQVGPWTKLGIVQMELNKTDSAVQSFQRSLKLQPTNRIANQRLGLIYEYTGDTEKAINYLRKGLAGTSEQYIGVSLNLGRLLNSTKRYPQTVALLEPKVNLSSEIPEAHAVLAAALLKTGEPQKAAKHFKRASELEPKNEPYRLGLAMSLSETDNFAEANTILDQLIHANPSWNIPYLEKADILLAQNNLTEANKLFEQALAKGANPVSINRRLGEHFLEHKMFADALPLYQQLVNSKHRIPTDFIRVSELYRATNALDKSLASLKQGTESFPNIAYIHFRYGSELAATRQYKRAATALSKAVELNPNDLASLRALSLVQAKIGDIKGATASAKKIYSLKPDTGETLFYASRLQANGEALKAIDLYNKVLKEDENNIVALNNAANIYADMGQLDNAHNFASKANGLLPDNAQLQDTLGWILYQQKQYSEAAKILTSAAAAATQNAKILYHTGMAMHKAGDNEAASTALKKAIELDASADWAADAQAALQKIN